MATTDVMPPYFQTLFSSLAGLSSTGDRHLLESRWCVGVEAPGSGEQVNEEVEAGDPGDHIEVGIAGTMK